ncbi:hypothetical protein ASE16_00475 [Leifsonia sp. Root227]|uniref:TetR/AcrR family transcriptional regulator n=1 Tax=Leifsonia sp. Root227 TaxID=1736496 RepID=UPI0006FD1E02|nr:TetR/AcrR family transcriptional regulator [Leifsonia sp. Root227]KRC51609.1 hypothetical protein ASE16_00475 [Leifsonia sp. Root227]
MPTPLSRTLILDTARAILDADGETALSMRTIAARLDVKAASLYNHIGSRHELLQETVDAIADEVMATLDPTDDWRTILTTLADRLRETLRAHPGSTKVVATVNISPALAQRMADDFGPPLARELRTTVEHALLTVQSLYVLVVGLALAEFGDVPNAPVASRDFYDTWFGIATTTFLDGIAARLATGGE